MSPKAHPQQNVIRTQAGSLLQTTYSTVRCRESDATLPFGDKAKT